MYLPLPVARYLRLALPSIDMPVIERATLHQVGRLRADAASQRWMNFEAVHTIAPQTPGFVWSARVSVLPGLHFRVIDTLVQGCGSGQVLLWSAIPIASDRGSLEIDSGALHRYLAEAVWSPTALLPSDRLAWQALDDRSALATLSVGKRSVSLEFRFNEADEVSAVYTSARWGRFGGRYEQRPWEGHFARYVECSGMRVPSQGEVGWYADGRWEPVWRGTMTGFRYEAAS